jgi:hypothetical protein
MREILASQGMIQKEYYISSYLVLTDLEALGEVISIGIDGDPSYRVRCRAQDSRTELLLGFIQEWWPWLSPWT